MKRIKILFVIFLMLFSLIGCKTDEVKTDNIRFKEEYESINGQLNDKGKTITTINIDENNSIRYIEQQEVVEALINGTHVVYFGWPECSWCRRALPVLIDAVNEYPGMRIYYFSIKQAREDYDNGVDSELAELYKEISKILLMSDVDFSEISEVDENGILRIVASMLIFVKNGDVIGAHRRTVSSHLDSYEELTAEQLKELKEIYDYFLQQMVIDDSSGCSGC
ncbi:MAG: DsbA family protein [Erysipelotrichaceae bacterium]